MGIHPVFDHRLVQAQRHSQPQARLSLACMVSNRAGPLHLRRSQRLHSRIAITCQCGQTCPMGLRLIHGLRILETWARLLGPLLILARSPVTPYRPSFPADVQSAVFWFDSHLPERYAMPYHVCCNTSHLEVPCQSLGVLCH